jgi:hypothetical protein
VIEQQGNNESMLRQQGTQESVGKKGEAEKTKSKNSATRLAQLL